MEKQKRSNLAIWKIDRDNGLIKDLSTSDAIFVICDKYNNKENVSENEKLKILRINEEEIKNKKIKIYHKQRRSIGWKNFIGENIINNKDSNIFSNVNNDFLCFIYDDKDIFLITAGAGYHAIQEYIDESFPLEVAKKVFVGEFSYAETRGLTGLTYSKSENFRRSYSFSRQEAFGKIWKKLSGKIDQEVIKSSPELALIIDPEKKINAEMKSSFTFRKAVSFIEVIGLVNAIQSLPLISKERSDKFKFLDTMREVKNKREKEKLNNKLFSFFYEIFKNNSLEEVSSFDFCHPSEAFIFFTGCNYCVDKKSISNSNYPSSLEVFEYLRDNDIVSLDNFDAFKNSFNKLVLSFQREEDDSLPSIDCSLIKCFHGEIKVGKKTYFYIDGKWYELIGTFLNNLLTDFIFEVFKSGENIVIDSLPLLEWEKNKNDKYDEGDYNLIQAKEKKFYFGDKTSVATGRGKLEPFDLLYVTNDKIYIIQVKNGFGASIRDACSQIEIASEIIEEDSKTGYKNLSRYYKEWKKHNGNNLSKEDFIDLFQNKERIYVLACSTSYKFEENTFNNKKLESNIAQYEILGLIHSCKGKGYKFKIQHINKKK